MNHDLFAPAPTEPQVSLTQADPSWSQIYLSRLDRTYRWALMPGTPTDERDVPPVGFVLEYFADRGGWSPVRFYPRRVEIWEELVKTGAIETDTTGPGPGSAK